MNNLMFRGIGKYPSAPFLIDKIYSSYKDMKETAAADGIYPGRFILIKYCDISFDQETRKAIHNGTIVPTSGSQEEKYLNNYIVDGFSVNDQASYFSHDGTIWVKALNEKGEHKYLPVANVNTSYYPVVQNSNEAGARIIAGEVRDITTINGKIYYGEIFNDYINNIVGIGAHAEGGYTKATGDYSHTEGYGTEATKKGGHAEGYNTKALNICAHAEGERTKASGVCSHVEGQDSAAEGDYSRATGQWSYAYGNYSQADGNTIYVYGANSYAKGTDIKIYGWNNCVEGSAIRVGKYGLKHQPRQGHIEGYDHSIDADDKISLNNNDNIASHFVHVEGGNHTLINAHSAHVEGFGHKVENSARVHVEGFYHTVISGNYSHVGGEWNRINNTDCFVHGKELQTTANSQVLFGQYNRISNANNVVFAIGAGQKNITTNQITRLNAFEVLSDGSATLHKQGDSDNSVVIKSYVDKIKTPETLISGSVALPKEDADPDKTIDEQIDEQLQLWWDSMPDDYVVKFFTIWINDSTGSLPEGGNLIRMCKMDGPQGVIETQSYQSYHESSGLRRCILGNVLQPWQHWNGARIDFPQTAFNGNSAINFLTRTEVGSDTERRYSNIGLKIKVSSSNSWLTCSLLPVRNNEIVQTYLGDLTNPWTRATIQNIEVNPSGREQQPEAAAIYISTRYDGQENKASGMKFITQRDSDGINGYLVPWKATGNNINGVYLGSSSFKWTAVFATNGTIQTSAREAKENIKNIVSEYTPATMSLRDEAPQLSDITEETIIDFVRNLQPVTFNYKGDTTQSSEQIGLIADDIADHPLYRYVGIDTVENVETIPAELDKEGNVIKEAITEEKRILGLQALPLATTALSVCKNLINRIDYLEAVIEEMKNN